MRKIINYNDKQIYVTDEEKLDSIFINEIPLNTLIIKVRNSFHPNFKKFPEIYELIESLNEYKNKFGDYTNLLFDFNESVVDLTGLLELEKLIKQKCYYMNFDMNIINDRQICFPHSMYTHLNYLIEDGFLEASEFLKNTILNYENILKPHKLIFFSNNINIVRIKIFNILKETNNLEKNIWSFNNNQQYYSNIQINLPQFLKDNEGIIPHSYDNFFDLRRALSELKFSLLPHYLTYFEILTESYYFTQILEIKNYTPCTEKIFKPIVGLQPFIVFSSPQLKSTLEKIGLTFNCDLYGFYDISSNTDITKGLEHVKLQVSKDIREIHKCYFDYVDEFINNKEIFCDFLIKNKETCFKKLAE